MIKAYLAGPDVFRADAKQFLERQKRLCRLSGVEPLTPLDTVIDLSEQDAAEKIYYANIKQIKQADVIVANVSPFRGPGMDAGTAFEIGFAIALGKSVYAYTDDARDYVGRVNTTDVAASEYPIVEDFGLVENLMIHIPSILLRYADFESTIRMVAWNHANGKL